MRGIAGVEVRPVVSAFGVALAGASLTLWLLPRRAPIADVMRADVIGGAIIVLIVGRLALVVARNWSGWLGGLMGLALGGAELGFGAANPTDGMNFDPQAALAGALLMGVLGLIFLSPVALFVSRRTSEADPETWLDPKEVSRYHEVPGDPGMPALWWRPNRHAWKRGVATIFHGSLAQSLTAPDRDVPSRGLLSLLWGRLKDLVPTRFGPGTVARQRRPKALLLLLVIAALVGAAILVATRLWQPSPLPTARLGLLAYGIVGDIHVADWDWKNPVRIADGPPPARPLEWPVRAGSRPGPRTPLALPRGPPGATGNRCRSVDDAQPVSGRTTWTTQGRTTTTATNPCSLCSGGPTGMGSATFGVTTMPLKQRLSSFAVAGALAAVLLSGTTGGAVAQGSTLLTMSSQPGDYIGGGQTYSYTPATATFTPHYYPGYAYFSVIMPGYEHWWYVDIAAAPGQPLLPGTYTNAVRAPFRGPGQPGLQIAGDGRGCNTLTGSFTVNQAVYDASNNILAFDATFEQHCERADAPALTGHISFHRTPFSQRAIGTATASKFGNSSVTVAVPATGIPVDDMVVLAVTTGTFAGAVGCADSKGNHYSVDADIRGGGGRLFICSARIVTPLASGDRITATYPGFSGVSATTATDFTGLSTIVRSATAGGNSTSPSVEINANKDDLVFGAVTFGVTPSFTAGDGFSAPVEAAVGAGSGRRAVDSEWLVAPITTNYFPGGVLSQARPWLVATVVYRP